MTSNFIGGAIATALSTLLYARFGWGGVATGAVCTAGLAALIWLADTGAVRSRRPNDGGSQAPTPAQ